MPGGVAGVPRDYLGLLCRFCLAPRVSVERLVRADRHLARVVAVRAPACGDPVQPPGVWARQVEIQDASATTGVGPVTVHGFLLDERPAPRSTRRGRRAQARLVE